MVVDRYGNEIKKGDRVKNIENGKYFIVDEAMELVLNHAELLHKNFKKVWIYANLEKVKEDK